MHDRVSRTKGPQAPSYAGRPRCQCRGAPPKMNFFGFRAERGLCWFMPLDDKDSGFLSRWSRRKVQVRQGGVALESGVPVAAAQTLATPTEPPPAAAAPQPTPWLAPAPAAPALPEETPAETPAPPTLADVAALTRDSDYSRFLSRSVQPDVKNAALGKLFTDPHFNVMDGLDVYIDDYGKPDPLPPGMLRQMLQAHVLGLFDDEDDKNKPHQEPQDKTAPLDAAAEPVCASLPPTEAPADENTDLQLQPDHGAGRASPEPGAGEDTGCAH